MRIHDTHQMTSAAGKERARRWLGRSLAAVALVAAGVAAGVFGSSSGVTVLNTEKVERAIERSTMDQRNKRVVVSCPSGVHQKQGLAFACMAVGKSGRTSFAVTQTDDAGQVHYQAQ